MALLLFSWPFFLLVVASHFTINRNPQRKTNTMTKPNDGGTAFPGTTVIVPTPGQWTSCEKAPTGMSLRAWFSGMALPGAMLDSTQAALKIISDRTTVPIAVLTAKLCIEHADALLSELNKQEKQP
jgi:hypothetical protein